MAPKRTKQAASTAPLKPAVKRRSKLAKENDITADQEAEIQEAFALFSSDKSVSKDSMISINDVRRCLIALNAPPSNSAELRELLEVIDPENSGWATYEHFLGVAALKINSRHEGDADAQNEEVATAYKLFTKGEDRDITIADLRRVARELREEVPENVLKDMIREATGGGLGGVGIDDFENTMRRAGVFG
ncbi:hypothetical protein M433DRAFT_330981 [Acidomyces richmondensis BFW]|nr:hypothetical protein M433DRAFT_330981 [Acidomyces richmondensis BFW]